MKAYILIILLLLMETGNLFSQKFPVAFQSPEAASLGIVSNIPVSYHTGKINIEIPLLELKEMEHVIPITISYNTSGILPNLRPGWVGQNWSLNAGGVITRSINNLPDESDLGFCHSYNRLQSNNWASDANLGAARSKFFFFIPIPLDYYDTEPDEFFFSVDGLNGKFYIGADGKFKVASEPGIKIESDFNDPIAIGANNGVTRPTFRGFTLTTAEGVIYRFGYNHNLIETSNLDPSGSGSLNAQASSWYLNEIELPKSKEKIKFNYTQRFDNQNYFSVDKLILSDWKWENGWKLSKPTGTCSSSGGYLYLSNISHIYLESIESSHFKLDFTISKTNDMKHKNETIHNWQKLDALTLTDKVTNTKIKRIEFIYNNTIGKRLFLQAIKESGTPPYEFQYQENNAHIEYETKAVDHWGYYNGSRNNTSLIGKTFRVDGDNTEYFDVERETDNISVKGGALAQIKYPTGGVVNFEFEANDYSQYCVLLDTISLLDVKRAWEPNWFFGSYLEGDNVSLQYPSHFKISIRKKISPSEHKDLKGILAPGTYSMEYFFNEAEMTGSPSEYRYSVQYKGLRPFSNNYAGGLRIKKVTTKDGGLETVREFKYVRNYSTSKNSTLSSGILGTQPNYNYEIDITKSLQGNIYSGYYDAYSSQPFFPLSLAQGCPVGYSEVIEIEKDKDGNELGYTVYKYSNFDTNPDSVPVNMLTAIGRDVGARNSKEYERGHLLSMAIYSQNGIRCQETNYTYDKILRDPFRAIEIGDLFAECYFTGPASIGHVTVAYHINNNSYKLIKETKTSFDLNGNNPIVKEINYKYDLYNSIKELMVSESDNSYLKTEYKYPIDFRTSYPYNEMVSKNIISPVVEKSEYKNTNIFLRKEVNNYTQWDSRFYAPANQQIQTGSGNLETRMVYSYDSKANIRELVKDDADKVVYLWSYTYQYPIAEIKGATYQEVKTALSYSDSQVETLASTISPTDLQIQTIGEKLRAYFQNKPVLVTTYTYKPLVGIQSVTDPRGVKTIYAYDSFGRLEAIRDHEGNLVETYDYHYQNQ